MAFTSEQVELLLKIARDASLGAGFEERLDGVTEALSALVSGTSVSAVVVDLPENVEKPGGYVYVRNRSQQLVHDYVTHYLEHDPMRDAMLEFGRAHQLSDFASPRRLGSDAFTGEFLPNEGIRHILGCSQAMPDGGLLLISIHRDLGQRNFNRKEREILRLATPDIARAAFGAILREKVAALWADSKEDESPRAGAIVFDALGDIIHSDDGASSLVRRIRTDVGTVEDQLVADVRQVAQVGAGESVGFTRTFRLDDGGFLRVRYSAMASAKAPGVLALLEVPVPATAAHFEAAADAMGLTPREKEIASLVIRGLGNQRIGYLLGISPITVGSHLTRIYEKTGAPGRGELTALLLGVEI